MASGIAPSMSLQVDDSGHRPSRSHSPGFRYIDELERIERDTRDNRSRDRDSDRERERERDRSRDHSRDHSRDRSRDRSRGDHAYTRDYNDYDYRSRPPPSPRAASAVADTLPPYPVTSGSFQDPSMTSVAYEYDRLTRWPGARDGDDDDDDDAYYETRRRATDYVYDPRDSRDRVGDGSYGSYGSFGSSPRHSRDSLFGRLDREAEKERERRRRKEKLEEDLAYGELPGPSRRERERVDTPPSPPTPPAPGTEAYAYAYSKPHDYGRPEDPRASGSRTNTPGPRDSGSKLGHGVGLSVSPPSPALRPVPLKSAMKQRDPSPQPPTARMSNLTLQIPGHHRTGSSSLSASSAPASPLMEAYHGTYQSMSPMPSPMLLPTSPGGQIAEPISPLASDIDEAEALSPGGNGSIKKKRTRRARFHDPVDDALRLAKALKGRERDPDTEPLIEILPGLTHEEVMALRAEYKKLVKTAPENKGVNVAKHIRMRLKDKDEQLMKACYTTALGRWESEGYWASFWYHGDKTRRELLIEALMGRTNEEIRKIKAGFRDKKYGDDLECCLRTELKEDKFKKAVMWVLEESRMEEVDRNGQPLPIDYDRVADDVQRLREVIKREKGGETLMLSIVLRRSDAHLREVLRVYKETYKGANFAKDALKKSGNLVVRGLFLLPHPLSPPSDPPLRLLALGKC